MLFKVQVGRSPHDVSRVVLGGHLGGSTEEARYSLAGQYRGGMLQPRAGQYRGGMLQPSWAVQRRHATA